MKPLIKMALIGVSAIAFTGTSALAEIVCNDDGDCWHVKTRHEYKPEFRLKVYGDDWKWRDEDHAKYRWREHEGRGYWNKGAWIEF